MHTTNENTTTVDCIICEQPSMDGINICNVFICSECEAEMIRTDVRDAKYPYFITQMKRIWYKKDA